MKEHQEWMLTWVEDFLGSRVTRTEGAVHLEVVGIVQERTADGEQHPLKQDKKH